MPGPAIRGRYVREIIVPQKTVVKNDCERCGRTWFSEERTDTAKAIVKMVGSNGSVLVDASYDILCESCGNTVQNLLKALARNMKKLGSSKPRAKKEGAKAPSEPNGSSLSVAAPAALPPPETSPARTPSAVVYRPPPSGPSRQQ